MDSINAIITLISSAKYAAFKTRVMPFVQNTGGIQTSLDTLASLIIRLQFTRQSRAFGNYLAILYPLSADWQ
jgi:hypothetical protein